MNMHFRSRFLRLLNFPLYSFATLDIALKEIPVLKAPHNQRFVKLTLSSTQTFPLLMQ